MEDILINIKGCSFEKLFNGKTLVSVEEVLSKVEDLNFEVKHLEETYRNLEQEIEDNYRPISKEEQYV